MSETYGMPDRLPCLCPCYALEVKNADSENQGTSHSLLADFPGNQSVDEPL
jgi:hypothetical protein